MELSSVMASSQFQVVSKYTSGIAYRPAPAHAIGLLYIFE